MTAFYNEFDPAAAHVLECLIKDRVIADGIVDRRSIADIDPKDLVGFKQCHFFAGGGFWSIALRLAGIPDDFECWTGSCPCQPLSVAGKQKGADDERHLWPAFYRLIAERRPAIVFGEQVAGKSGFEWFAGVRTDLEGAGYACGAADLCAAGAGAPHIRQRLYWCAVADAASRNAVAGRIQRSGVDGLLPQGGCDRGPAGDAERAESDMADADRCGRSGRAQEPQRGEERRAAAERPCGDVEHAESVGRREGRPEHEIRGWRSAIACAGCGDMADTDEQGRQGWPVHAERADERAARQDGVERGYWDDYEWRVGADGKARRVGVGLRSMVDGRSCGMVHLGQESDGDNAETLPLLSTGEAGRVAMLRILGNAIVPQVAQAFIEAVMETIDA